MDRAVALVHEAMALLCHQLPERSFGSGSFVAPLCYRCSAFYAAYAGSLLVVVSSRARPRAVASLVLGAILVVVMGVDVALGCATNVSRVATGLLAGAGAGLVAGRLLSLRLRPAVARGPTATWWLAWAGVVATSSLAPMGLDRPEVSAGLAVLGVLVVAATMSMIVAGTRVAGGPSRRLGQ